MRFARRSTVVSEIASELREMILTGNMQPGQFLPPQKALASQFGVGLSTIHEALQVLSSAGLIQSCPGKGTWVSQDAMDTLVHPTAVKTRLGDMSFRVLHEARSVIEVALSELAAQRATKEDVARIWQAVEAMEALGRADGSEAYAQTDLQFHLAVARAGHNELLEQFYHVAFKFFSEFISELVALPDARKDAFRVRNRELAEAIEERDPKRARQVALNIIRDVDRLLEPVVREANGAG